MKFINLYNIILESRLDDYKIQLKDDQLANNIFSLNNPKKEKMIIKWIKNGSIKYPKDIQIVNKAYQIINRKQLDYNKYNNPQQILKKYSQLSNKLQYNPDNEPAFTNKVDLGKGVVVYNVQDDEYGQLAVRKAVDYNWGKEANPWCIIAKKEDGSWKGDFWNQYSAIPKRICFQNNKLIAFCASKKLEIQWWDRDDKPTNNIPIEGVDDNLNIINDILKNKSQRQKNLYYSEYSKDPNQLDQIYQKYKNDRDIKDLLAMNQNCSAKLLYQLSKDKQVYVIMSVAKNPNCPLDLLQKLSNSDHRWIRECVARNKNTPKEILEKLSDDTTGDIKNCIAGNLNCPKEILQKLSKDKNYIIRLTVAHNENCPLEILQKLSKDISSSVRQQVAHNLNTPSEILQKLSIDKNWAVRQNVAGNKNTPKEILVKLSKDEDNWVRCFVATNLNTPIKVLQKLSKDKNLRVRQEVASNPNTPKEIKEKMKR